MRLARGVLCIDSQASTVDGSVASGAPSSVRPCEPTFCRPCEQTSFWHPSSLPYDQLQFWSGAPVRSPGGSAGADPHVAARNRSVRSRRYAAASRRAESEREHRSRRKARSIVRVDIIWCRRSVARLCYRATARGPSVRAACSPGSRCPVRQLPTSESACGTGARQSGVRSCNIKSTGERCQPQHPARCNWWRLDYPFVDLRCCVGRKTRVAVRYHRAHCSLREYR